MSTMQNSTTRGDSGTPSGRSFTPEHLAWLSEKCAIGQDVIEATGAYSALQASDLPASLEYRKDELPGVVFALNRVDGSTVYQFRPDRPADPEKKYGQEPGSGSVVCMHPWMNERLDAAMDEHANGGPKPHMVAVEGTKQYLTFVENAPETITVKVGRTEVQAPLIAFGIQGCRNWSSEGSPTTEMTGLLGKAGSLTILFDGDRLTNPAVYDAGKDLAEFARLRGADLVRFGSVAGGGAKADLDGTLSRVPAGERDEFLTRLLDGCSDKMGRRPADKKAVQRQGKPDKIGRVDWEAGVIYEPDTVMTDRGVTARMPSDEVLARFAARIVRTIAITDDLNSAEPVVEHDLEVRLEGHERTYLVPNVPDAGLREIRSWLNRVADGQGALAIYDNTDNGARKIENTIRAYETDLLQPVRSYRRTGWVKDPDGVWRYLTPTGAIGPDGVAEDIFSRLDIARYQDEIRIPDPDEHDDAMHAESVREYIQMGQRLVDPLPWYATAGAMAYASTGAPPRAGLILAGGHGSGKTVITQTAATAYGPAFYAEGGVLMGSMNGTANAVGSIGQGLHHMLVIVDDVRRRQSPRAQEAQDIGVEDLIRRTYEGGSAGRARMRIDRQRNGRIVTDSPDASSPMIMFTAEYIPSAEAVGSSVERLLSIKVTRANTMKEGETPSMAAIGKSGRPAIAWSGFLRWQAQKIAEHGGLDAWVQQQAEDRATAMEDMKSDATALGAALSSRALQVASPPIVGWTLLLEYAEEIGALSADEAEALAEDADIRLTKAAIRHSMEELSSELTPFERLLSQIRSMISDGTARFEEQMDEAVRNRPVIGKTRSTPLLNPETGEKEPVDTVILNPDAIAKALGPGNRMTGAGIARLIAEKAERGSENRTGWKVKINGQTIRDAIVLRKTIWEGEGDGLV